MKKFNEFNRLNEASDPEQELLENLFSFFYKKYSKVSISEVESNFIKSAIDLLKDGEITQESIDTFFKSKGISPEKTTKKSVKPIDQSGSMRNITDDDSDWSDCGSSRPSPRTSHC